MAISLIIHAEDNRRIKHLKKEFGIHKKIDVIRAGLVLLEREAEHVKRVKRWKRAAKLVAKSSYAIHEEFRRHSQQKLR